MKDKKERQKVTFETMQDRRKIEEIEVTRLEIHTGKRN